MLALSTSVAVYRARRKLLARDQSAKVLQSRGCGHCDSEKKLARDLWRRHSREPGLDLGQGPLLDDFHSRRLNSARSLRCLETARALREKLTYVFQRTLPTVFARYAARSYSACAATGASSALGRNETTRSSRCHTIFKIGVCATSWLLSDSRNTRTHSALISVFISCFLRVGFNASEFPSPRCWFGV
jgi:hypothetical protein